MPASRDAVSLVLALAGTMVSGPAVSAGSVTRTLGAGSARFAFDGWVRGKRLAPGSYRATLQAVDAAGNRSSKAAPRLHVVRAGRRSAP